MKILSMCPASCPCPSVFVNLFEVFFPTCALCFLSTSTLHLPSFPTCLLHNTKLSPILTNTTCPILQSTNVSRWFRTAVVSALRDSCDHNHRAAAQNHHNQNNTTFCGHSDSSDIIFNHHGHLTDRTHHHHDNLTRHFEWKSLIGTNSHSVSNN